MIRTVIVDDEPHSVHRIKELLKEFPDCDIVGEAYDGASALDMIRSLRPDLVFLDIRMPVMTGFEVLEKIDHSPLIVFVTAYDSYAVKAFEKDGIDYILKPVSAERFAVTMRRVFSRRQTVTHDMLELLRTVALSRNYINRFAVRSRAEILVIPESEVYYFKAEDKYVFLCTDGNEFIYETTLKDLETMLDPEKFLRIHKTYIVALGKIKKIKKTVISDHIIVLSDGQGTQLRVGRGFVSALRATLKM